MSWLAAAADWVVSELSPSAGIRRRRERNLLRAMGGYESGKQSRLHDAWNPSNRSADAEYLKHGKLTRARARDLYRNNAYARSIVRAWVRNVVGKGIRPQARTDNKPFNILAESLWNRWCKVADITGRMNFYQTQALALTEVLVAGETLVHFVEDTQTPFRPVPLAVQVIDIDRLAEDYHSDRIARQKVEDGNELRMGIEYDSDGVPVAYHVKRHHPNDLLPYKQEIDRISARNILHLYQKDRAGQSRGISIFAPVVWWLKNLGSYVENEVVTSAIAACFGVAIKTVDGGDSPGLGDRLENDTSDDAGNSHFIVEPGMNPRLLPGEDIEVINPNRGASNQDAFVSLMTRSMAAGTGVGYERISRDYSKTNFSSNRASELEDRREFMPMEEFLESQLNQPIWERLMVSGADEQLEGFPNPFDFLIDQDEWMKSEWTQILGREWVDPKNEAQADEIAVKNRWMSKGDIVKKRTGRDYEDHLKKLSDERDLEEQYGFEDEPELTEDTPSGSEAEMVDA